MESTSESLFSNCLTETDPEIFAAIKEEEKRQDQKIEMIASENMVSRAVLEVQGSVLTNKYAEGYPGARYYGGCENVDVVEDLARERACQLFGAEYANVQPHAGSSANLAVYSAVLNLGDKILGMELAHGGHLTHGSPVNFSGKQYQIVSYGVSRETKAIDMEELRRIALREKPRMIVAGISAYPRTLDFKAFGEIARECDAYLMADIAHIAGLVAAGLHPSPVPHADFVTTTTHKTLRGPRGGLILCKKEHARRIDKTVFPGIQGGPLMHVIAAKAVALKEAMESSFIRYQECIKENAAVLAEALLDEGLDLVTGGTDNHMILVDLQNQHLTGKEAEEALERIGITCNKNAVPFDPQSPKVTSGIRLGSSTVTTRGMGPSEMRRIARIIKEALDYRHEPDHLERLQGEMKALCDAFPAVYSF